MPLYMKVGINGFGRIGKCIYKILSERGIDVPLINDPFIDIEYMRYLVVYDTVYGKMVCNVEDDAIVYNNKQTRLSKFKIQNEIPWKDYGIDYVVEATGIFTTYADCAKHNAKRIILTAPSTDIPMFVYGVNHTDIKDQKVISAASCTTNCLAPLVKILHDNFCIEEALMTTVHAVTATQKATDGKGQKWRSARSLYNIIPASTGAAKAVSEVIPELKGKINGMAFRVPVLNVSVIDLTVRFQNKTSLAEIVSKINNCGMPDIIGTVSELIVSSDINGEPRSSILDVEACIELNPRFFKLISWYDNEYGYSCRVADILQYLDQ